MYDQALLEYSYSGTVKGTQIKDTMIKLEKMCTTFIHKYIFRWIIDVLYIGKPLSEPSTVGDL